MADRDGGVARAVLQGLWSSAVGELEAQEQGGKRGARDAAADLAALRAALAGRFFATPTEPLFVQTLQVICFHLDDEIQRTAGPSTTPNTEIYQPARCIAKPDLAALPAALAGRFQATPTEPMFVSTLQVAFLCKLNADFKGCVDPKPREGTQQMLHACCSR